LTSLRGFFVQRVLGFGLIGLAQPVVDSRQLTFASVAVLFLLVALAAATFRRAGPRGIDPMSALRVW